MTDRELMQQALEALNRSDYLGWQLNIPIIKSLRDRLAQPEQEPVAYASDVEFDDETEIIPAEQKGKLGTAGLRIPLYIKPPASKPLTDEAKAVIDAARAAMDDSVEAYDSEGSIKISSDLAASLSLCLDEYDRAIEAKLREKNHG